MAELYGIMSMLDPSEFGDEDEFLERYGGGRLNPMPSPDQIQALQVPACACWLRPYASSCSSCAHVTMSSMPSLDNLCSFHVNRFKHVYALISVFSRI